LTRPGWGIERIGFERAQRRWMRDRAVEQTQEIGAEGLDSFGSDLRSLPADRAVHVVVVPQEGEDFGNYTAGTCNHYWEAGQRLSEMLGPSSVSTYSVPRGTSAAEWHRGLLAHVVSSGATHVITHVESDPGSQGGAWTWDVPARVLAESWDGSILGVMFDSAFPWITAKSRLLARMSDRFLGVDICIPLSGELVRGRPEVGPVNMPLSEASLALVDERIADVVPQWDVSFIGAMYPYRVELVERLRDAGVSVAVNPHRADAAEDFASSRRDQPGWLDYMAGLAASRMTINFSRSSAGPIEQLKTRVLEATVAGTVLLTDDTDRTGRFWVEGQEFVTFSPLDAVPDLVTSLLADPARVEVMARRARHRAREIALWDFWVGIDQGLRLRGLRPVLPTSAA
jgi:hypothetical protein